jgi:hypothetical protein
VLVIPAAPHEPRKQEWKPRKQQWERSSAGRIEAAESEARQQQVNRSRKKQFRRRRSGETEEETGEETELLISSTVAASSAAASRIGSRLCPGAFPVEGPEQREFRLIEEESVDDIEAINYVQIILLPSSEYYPKNQSV